MRQPNFKGVVFFNKKTTLEIAQIDIEMVN